MPQLSITIYLTAQGTSNCLFLLLLVSTTLSIVLIPNSVSTQGGVKASHGLTFSSPYQPQLLFLPDDPKLPLLDRCGLVGYLVEA